MRNFFVITISVALLFLAIPRKVHAATLDCSMPFPNEVACFNNGEHGVPGEIKKHTGFDVVMRWGDTNFSQIFQGDEEGTIEQEESVWMVSDYGTCIPGWTFVKDAKGSGWGDYFPAGVDYCVFTTDHKMLQPQGVLGTSTIQLPPIPTITPTNKKSC